MGIIEATKFAGFTSGRIARQSLRPRAHTVEAGRNALLITSDLADFILRLSG